MSQRCSYYHYCYYDCKYYYNNTVNITPDTRWYDHPTTKTSVSHVQANSQNNGGWRPLKVLNHTVKKGRVATTKWALNHTVKKGRVATINWALNHTVKKGRVATTKWALNHTVKKGRVATINCGPKPHSEIMEVSDH